jgi:branched-chain amino acid transport system substrate-binding protein
MVYSGRRLVQAATLTAAAVVVGMALSACSSSNSSSGGSTGAYKIGFSGDLTAQTAAIGNGLLNGIKTEFDTVNAKGGVNGRKINLAVTDDASDPSKARVAVQTYSTQGVLAVVGANESAVWTPLAPIVAGYPMTVISVGVADAQISPPKPYIYRSQLGTSDFPTTQIDFTKNYLIPQKLVPSNPKVAIFGYTSPSVTVDRQNLHSTLPGMGWSISSDQSFDTTATNATTQATVIAGSHPDVVFGYFLDSDAPFAVRELRQQGYKGPIVDFGGANGVPTFSGLADPAYYSESTFAFPEDTTNTGAVAMLAAAKKTGNAKSTNTPFFTQGYLQAVAVVDALQKCASTCDAKAFNTAFESIGDIDTNGLTQNFAVSSTRHEMPGAVHFYVWDTTAKTQKAVGDYITLPR